MDGESYSIPVYYSIKLRDTAARSYYALNSFNLILTYILNLDFGEEKKIGPIIFLQCVCVYIYIYI
jgi:hypothetical protein